MLARMVEVHNLNRAGKVDGADISGGVLRTCLSLWDGVALYYYLPRLVVWTCGGTILCKVAATSACLNP